MLPERENYPDESYVNLTKSLDGLMIIPSCSIKVKFFSNSSMFIRRFFLLPIAHFKVLVATTTNIKELCKSLSIGGTSEFLERGKNRYIWHPGFSLAGAVALQALFYLNFKKVANDLGTVETTQINQFFAIF